jgi:hypothetical protein
MGADVNQKYAFMQVLTHCRKGQEDSSTADLTEIVTTPQEEGRHLAADASSSTKIYVEGMCCSSEATTIHDILDRLPGVLQVNNCLFSCIKCEPLEKQHTNNEQNRAFVFFFNSD